VNRVETPEVRSSEVPKFGDNLYHSSKETRVRISACSGIRRSGEMRV
jgi:hypothetical protein